MTTSRLQAAPQRDSLFRSGAVRSPLAGELSLYYSPLSDIPVGGGVLDWGLPLESDSFPTLYIRMNPGFSIPLDGVPGTPSIALVPQESPPTGRFPVETPLGTEYVDLELTVFV